MQAVLLQAATAAVGARVAVATPAVVVPAAAAAAVAAAGVAAAATAAVVAAAAAVVTMMACVRATALRLRKAAAAQATASSSHSNSRCRCFLLLSCPLPLLLQQWEQGQADSSAGGHLVVVAVLARQLLLNRAAVQTPLPQLLQQALQMQVRPHPQSQRLLQEEPCQAQQAAVQEVLRQGQERRDTSSKRHAVP